MGKFKPHTTYVIKEITCHVSLLVQTIDEMCMQLPFERIVWIPGSKVHVNLSGPQDV